MFEILDSEFASVVADNNFQKNLYLRWLAGFRIPF